MVERSAVNRLVVGSNPTAPANMVEWRNGSRNGLKIRWDNSRVGSSPTSTTNCSHSSIGESNALLKRRLVVRTHLGTPNIFGGVAQWLEQPAHNWLVGGSNPSAPTCKVSVIGSTARLIPVAP